MKVLLAVDGSRFSEKAVQKVLDQAQAETLQVVVLHVVNPMLDLPVYSAYGPAQEIDKIEKEMTAEAVKVVSGAVDKLKAAKLDVTATIEKGDPKKVILEKAAAMKADLIVLGSHGRKGVDRFLLGSVSEAVARHAPCSVQIVRAEFSKEGAAEDEAAVYAKECAHPPCTCLCKSGKYCSAQCEAMEGRADIDCRCGHGECTGRAH